MKRRSTPWLRRGRFIAFLGSDGSGKSTLIERTSVALEASGIPTSTRHMHTGLLPALGRLARKPPEGPVTDPHAKKTSGFSMSLVRFLYYWVDYVAGYWLALFPRLLMRREVVIFDRYAYDYLVDPRRGRVALPLLLRKGLIALVPEPDVVLILRAEPSVLFARKPEVPLQELEQQAVRLQGLEASLGNAQVVDTGGSLEQSTSDALAVVMETLSLGSMEGASAPGKR